MTVNGVGVLDTGRLILAYFTPRDPSGTYDRVLTLRGTAAAVTGGPPQAQVGVYREDPSGDLTLVASSAPGDPTWDTANTEYVSTLDAPVTFLTDGTRYAVAFLWVANGATGTCDLARYSPSGPNSTARSGLLAKRPRIVGYLAAQTGMPATISAAALSNTDLLPYAGVLATGSEA